MDRNYGRARRLHRTAGVMLAFFTSLSLNGKAQAMLPRAWKTGEMVPASAARSANRAWPGSLLGSRSASDTAALPDAPLPQTGEDASNGAIEGGVSQGSASVAGTVADTTGAALPGAKIILLGEDGAGSLTQFSNAAGAFTFAYIPSGRWRVIVTAQGFEPFRSATFQLVPHQTYSLSNIRLAVASASAQVTVYPTEVIAARQIKAEEKQRVLGIVPNFYVSYIPDAAPLTSRQKLSLAAHDTLDWTSFVGVSAAAGIEQANNSFAGYGQGAAGYAKRWAAQFGNGRFNDFFSHYVFASLLHQDPRYFYQGTGTRKSRLLHALSSAFVARGDNGKNMPNYSYLLGTMCSGALSNAYYPQANRGANLVFTNAAIGIAGRAGAAVLQEFLGKRLTSHAPKN